MINYVIAVNDINILNSNFRHVLPSSKFIIQREYTNIPQAYNEAIPRCQKSYICFLHQDVYLPAGWEREVIDQIRKLNDDWGVLGVAGVKLHGSDKLYLGYISDRGCKWGSPKGLPVEVDTLDELLLIIKNDGSIKFDEGVKNHFYGADICMQAKLENKKNYALEAFCLHNSIHGGELYPDFWESYEYMKEKYKDSLPIGTTCTIVQ